jgi:hypothetical protein
MNDQPQVVVIGDDSTSKQIQSMLVRHNITVLGAGLAAGMSIEQISSMCIPISRTAPLAKVVTDEDRRRIAAAEEKRNRRAAKRATKEA